MSPHTSKVSHDPVYHVNTLCIGLDVRKESIAVASVAQDHGAEVTFLDTIGTRQADIDQPVVF